MRPGRFHIDHDHQSMNRPPPSVLQTPGFAHYGMAWSPFHSGRLAVASSANYGLVGNGRLHLTSLGVGPVGQPALNLEKQCVAEIHDAMRADTDLLLSCKVRYAGRALRRSVVRDPREPAGDGVRRWVDQAVGRDDQRMPPACTRYTASDS